MNNDEAREYFKSKGLDYTKIKSEDLNKLSDLLDFHLAKYKLEGGLHAQQMNMKLRKRILKDTKFNNEQLIYARFLIDGAYFAKREGITFNDGGFIGFGGEFSTVNTQPIINAFIEWCDYLVSEVQHE